MGERVFQPAEPPRRRAARASFLALIGFIGLSSLVPIARAGWAHGSIVAVPLPWSLGPVLYPISGLAAWLVWRRIDVGLDRKRAALRSWGWQLLFSGLWPAALFNLRSPIVTGSLLILLLLAAVTTWLAFRRLQRGAALLMLPYFAWLFYLAVMSADLFWRGAI